jgi:hypothetical protein
LSGDDRSVAADFVRYLHLTFSLAISILILTGFNLYLTRPWIFQRISFAYYAINDSVSFGVERRNDPFDFDVTDMRAPKAAGSK